MEDHRNPALHIGKAGAVQRIRVEPLLVLERVILGKHRIHMAGEQQPPFGFGPDAQDQMLAEPAFDFAAVRVDRGDRGGVDQFDLTGQRCEGIGQFAGQFGQPVEIGGAGVDRTPRACMGEHRILLDRRDQRFLLWIKFHLQRPLAGRVHLSKSGQEFLGPQSVAIAPRVGHSAPVLPGFAATNPAAHPRAAKYS